MAIFNPNKNIENADDYIGFANQIFEEYLLTFTLENKLIREVNDDDWVDHEKFDFIYTTKGIRLALRAQRLLTELGNKYFPNEDEDIEIESYLFQED